MDLRTDPEGKLLSPHFPDRTEAGQGSDRTTGTGWDPNDSGLEESEVHPETPLGPSGGFPRLR